MLSLLDWQVASDRGRRRLDKPVLVGWHFFVVVLKIPLFKKLYFGRPG